jgi:pilus assembly protein CpaB
MLVAAILLGLAAVFFARMFLLNPAGEQQTTQNVQTVSAVVAAQPFAFGEKIVPEKLKVVAWPANGLPPGSFQRIADAVGTDDNRVALRAIDANELLTEKAVSGKDTRLSGSPLLGKEMRAVSVPIGEASGAGGFLAPGDRVDVYVTHPAGEETLPYTDQLMQNVRVLAVGQDKNLSKDKPEIVKTATLEVTLRNLVDETRTRLETAQVLDLTDGTIARVIRKPKAGGGGGGGETVRGPGGQVQAKPEGPSIEVFRGTAPTIYPVPSGK